MSDPTNASINHGQLRTLAVRITEDLRARLDVVAQLTGRSATEEIRLALEHWIEKTRTDPEVLKKAKQVQKEIERKAQTQRDAIAAIFDSNGAEDVDADPSATTSSASRRSEAAGK